jgi:DNA-directed RNA polymerase subunit RPC12/RpoP
MSIKFACGCGRAFAVPDTLAGKTTRCPTCQNKLVVPAAAADDGGWEVIDEPTASPPPPPALAPTGNITFSCGCGQELEVEAEFAGQEVECPTCQKVVRAPSPTPTLARRAARMAPAEGDGERTRHKRSATDKYMRDARRRMRDEEERESRNRGGGMGAAAIGSLIAAIFFLGLSVVIIVLTGRIPIIWMVLCLINLGFFVKNLASGE